MEKLKNVTEDGQSVGGINEYLAVELTNKGENAHSVSKAKVDQENLDEQIESMMCRSNLKGLENRIWRCKVCGKERIRDAIKNHIEARHIKGLIHHCEICGMTSKSRHALAVHKSNKHRKRNI